MDARSPGFVYHLAGEGGDTIVVSVRTSVEAAEEAFSYRKQLPSVCPPPPPEGEPIGEEMTWGYWLEGPHSPGASITFRRRNVLFTLRKKGDPSAVVELARRIDALVQNDRQIAPLGTFAETPQIVDAGIPPTLTKEAPLNRPPEYDVPIHPVIRGMGDPDKVRLLVLTESGSVLNRVKHDGRAIKHVSVPHPVLGEAGRKRVLASDDGRFVIKVPRQTGPLKLTLVAANDQNVVATKTVQVSVVEP
jgi:hypothetical protein